ncbi:MAG: N-acetylglucosamine kinase [Bacteroidetes bacterium]|nr:N-acetylglucosamine kinase [Bacteroidota bacterium]
MILIADSGSTKTAWYGRTQDGNDWHFSCLGFNPMFHTSQFIASELQAQTEIREIAREVTGIHYYGASVSSPDRVQIVRDALAQVFPNAVSEIEHDMLGAVRATCGQEPGVACILGTGSNSCFFDGSEIHEPIPSLGYVLGDEGSGSAIGKRLLQWHLYGMLPVDVSIELNQKGAVKEEVFNKVYREPGANVYLSSFSRFVGSRIHEAWANKLVYDQFEEFLRYHVAPYTRENEVPAHFVGSVAGTFEEILRDCCDNHGIECGTVLKSPLEGLVRFHFPPV